MFRALMLPAATLQVLAWLIAARWLRIGLPVSRGARCCRGSAQGLLTLPERPRDSPNGCQQGANRSGRCARPGSCRRRTDAHLSCSDAPQGFALNGSTGAGQSPTPDALLDDIQRLIQDARRAAAAAVNVSLTMLYWRIGKRIREDVLGSKRAGYGEEIVATLSRQLVGRHGRGFEAKNLRRMVQFAEAFAEEAIVATLWRHLSWSHFRELLPLKHPLQREFYAEMCRIEGWSVRTLGERIDSMLYERTALSRKPDALIRSELEALRTRDQLAPTLVLKDPYVLDFLGVADRYVERDLEDAILRDLEAFLLELGAGFAFVARQKRIQVDGDDFYIDLLFYNRLLRRLVAVELKLGRFKPADEGQMELYLRWLDRHERAAGEERPLGLILCADKKVEQVELLELRVFGIHVAEYLTVLPPRELLAERLHAAVAAARMQHKPESM